MLMVYFLQSEFAFRKVVYFVQLKIRNFPRFAMIYETVIMLILVILYHKNTSN